MFAMRKFSAGLLAFGLVALVMTSSKAEQMPKWTVSSNGSDCIVMEFSAILKFEIFQTPVPIPSNAVSDGICGGNFSTFQLEFDSYNDTEIDIDFLFIKSATVWQMTKVLVELQIGNDTVSTEVDVTGEDFTVPNGQYLECDEEREIPGEHVGLTFTAIGMMQPFAEGDTGTAYSCVHDDDSSGGPNIGLIVGCVIGGMAVLVIVCCVYNRVSSRNKRYRQNRNTYQS